MSWKRKALCGRFESGHPRCCAQLISNVRQCDDSTLQSRRGPCGRTAAHRPTHFCKNAAPAILPEANLVLPPTKGVASCPYQNSVVCVRSDARKKTFLRHQLHPPNPAVSCRFCQLARQHIAPYREDHPRPRRQQGRDEGAEPPRQDETTHTLVAEVNARESQAQQVDQCDPVKGTVLSPICTCAPYKHLTIPHEMGLQVNCLRRLGMAYLWR